jgi:hypothetical protein
MTLQIPKCSFPFASSIMGTILVSVTAVWLATSLAYGPVVATPDSGSVRSKFYNPPDHPLYRLSPIPPGADWTS